MLAHKTWEEKDWEATDSEDREGEIVEDEDKKPRQGNQKRDTR